MGYIKQEDALKLLDRNSITKKITLADGVSIYDSIKKLPTADVVEVKHAHIVRNERNIAKMKEFHEKGYALSMNEKSIFYTCSCCGFWCSLSQNYCSECGAKMDGGKEE